MLRTFNTLLELLPSLNYGPDTRDGSLSDTVTDRQKKTSVAFRRALARLQV